MATVDTELVAPLGPAVRPRNAFLDALFYDVNALTDAEAAGLSPIDNREGSVVVVPPTASGKPIQAYPTAAEFLDAHRETVRAVAVAGVGSSVLGTAALARNVADAYGVAVAGVVSGYGMSDLITEAVGGWFFYGATDAIRHGIRVAVDRWGRQSFPVPSRSAVAPDRTGRRAAFRPSDADTLAAILADAPPNLALLVGHSKGCLLLDYALEAFARRLGDRPHRYFDGVRVVTFGTVTDVSARFRNVHQFIGAIDWFGGMNSRPDVPHDRVSGAWHHLNTSLPCHLPVRTVLQDRVPIA